MRAALAVAAALLATQAHAGCADDSDTPCSVPLGDYHIMLPDGVDTPPALLFLHGAGGNGKQAMRMKTALNRGYAVIGPDGLKRPNSRFGPGWSFHPARPQQRDEIAFMREILADAAARHGIDRDRVLLAGFGMQIWREVNGCKGRRADSFDTSGNFWIRSWDTCDNGALDFVLHPGGHGIPKGWSNTALDWFEGLDLSAP